MSNDVPTGGGFENVLVLIVGAVIVVLWKPLRDWVRARTETDLDVEHAKSGCPALMMAIGLLIGVMFGRGTFMTGLMMFLLIWGLTGISKSKGD